MIQDKININIAVDVLKALSERSLDNSLYMMDDSSLDSHHQGTANLCTLCLPGQTIHWVVYALDVQTAVAIRNISFGKFSEEEKIPEENPDLKTWTGIVPCMEMGRQYYYRLTLQMGHGMYSVMSVDSPSLLLACPACGKDND